MSEQRKIPPFIYEQCGMTKREWKSAKRKQVREAVRLLRGELLSGAAYLPDGNAVMNCVNRMEKLQEEMSVKKWGR